MKKSDIKKADSFLYPKKSGQQPITKKAACELLNMPYNPEKLDRIIGEYRAEQKRWEESKDLPLTQDQVVFVIQSYIDGDTLLSISKKVLKTQDQILRVLHAYDVPIRDSSADYFTFPAVPQQCRRKKFFAGDIVYAVRYQNFAEIRYAEKTLDVYCIWLLDKQFFASQKAEHLASLTHLVKLGIKI